MQFRASDHVPVRVVNLLLSAQKLLLPRLVSVVAADLVTILLGLEEGSEVKATPHLLTGELTAQNTYINRWSIGNWQVALLNGQMGRIGNGGAWKDRSCAGHTAAHGLRGSTCRNRRP